VEGRADVGVLPTGQVVGVIESLPSVAEIIDGVMAEADGVLRKWALPGPAGENPA
jgi:NAD(P)H-dependent flavin oxidoreductase YrpB (nitropropane dioxygenase family)